MQKSVRYLHIATFDRMLLGQSLQIKPILLDEGLQKKSY
jgi:hypothetical protein